MLHVQYTKKIKIMARLNGSVVSYDEGKGCGYIKNDATGEQYLVYDAGLIDAVSASDKVTFELKSDKKGKIAVKVRKG